MLEKAITTNVKMVGAQVQITVIQDATMDTASFYPA